jgi:hypothetical protein
MHWKTAAEPHLPTENWKLENSYVKVLLGSEVSSGFERC